MFNSFPEGCNEESGKKICQTTARKAENEGVTEDNVSEIKNNISAFRFELIEIMRASGTNTQSATGPSGKYTNNIFLY